MILCLMLRKRFARSVLLLHQACQPFRQHLHEIVVLGSLCAHKPRLHPEALLAYFAMLPPQAITFLAHFYRSLLRILAYSLYRSIYAEPLITPTGTAAGQPRGPARQPLVDFFAPSARSRAKRFAVRFFAAALAAFLARADRSSAVMFLAAFFPPWLP